MIRIYPRPAIPADGYILHTNPRADLRASAHLFNSLRSQSTSRVSEWPAESSRDLIQAEEGKGREGGGRGAGQGVRMDESREQVKGARRDKINSNPGLGCPEPQITSHRYIHRGSSLFDDQPLTPVTCHPFTYVQCPARTVTWPKFDSSKTKRAIHPDPGIKFPAPRLAVNRSTGRRIGASRSVEIGGGGARPSACSLFPPAPLCTMLIMLFVSYRAIS